MNNMFYKTKLFSIMILLLSSLKVYASETIPEPINEKDKNLYIEIFSLQENGDFQKAKELTKKLANTILLGRVEAQKYLHPTGYISKFSELKKWLHQIYFNFFRSSISGRPPRYGVCYVNIVSI